MSCVLSMPCAPHLPCAPGMPSARSAMHTRYARYGLGMPDKPQYIESAPVLPNKLQYIMYASTLPIQQIKGPQYILDAPITTLQEHECILQEGEPKLKM